jgi:3-oxoacyl-[acyl-carrier protein] reductase
MLFGKEKTMPNYGDLFTLKVKVAIVTGAAAGLGEAIALGYSEYGSLVVLVDIDEGKIDQLAQQISGRGGRALGIKADVRKIQDVKRVVDATLGEFGCVDILMNNAGIGRRANAEDMTDPQWDEVLDVNLKGAFYSVGKWAGK